MLRIRAIASYVPDTTEFHAVQAQERNIGYGHLLYKAAAFALPRGKGKIDEEEQQRLLPPAAIALPVAPPLQSHADLALEAVAMLRQQLTPQALAEITHIVVTNAALNQRINESVAGRIQHALGLPDALPFAIGQSGSAGAFNALSIIEALISTGAKVLLVASDKWLYPFFRSWGELVVYGDGAAAILLDGAPEQFGQAASDDSWGSIRASAMHYGEAIDNPWGLTPLALAETLHPLAVSAAQSALERSGLGAADIDWVLPAGFNDNFTLGVSKALGIPAERHFERGAHGHQSSADPLLSLLRLRAALPPGKKATALLWDAALCGMAGAMVAEITAPQ
ncbi:3-oxoacyl-[acyl-carrier-protein] synthase III C-terminal domain-containing protein [Collimonas sp.]|jgi:3-oxoacyl-[acyl-carrier-protein] synthase III|uniref:3-oxoacyl-[acyl-carrier-protein] synthase III C-terminal domain-containing protein n=1 Tax=Collimonas sp. TaxID=1963772 RepID=UPI002B7F1DC2|nr:3-oxoacyl-[acyl-carrier-protein] synthase III C-terminal domain-containing protein [Collimonas sp.]HWX01899.1 3-oxoacyl-[acyl-carrier-protein] synthase III C-terminal domain-containing protein [Collimonas sp.]